MALAILVSAALRLSLHTQLRISSHISVQLLLPVAVVVLLGVTILADPGRIDNRCVGSKTMGKMLLMAEEIISLVLALLVVGRAVNLLQ